MTAVSRLDALTRAAESTRDWDGNDQDKFPVSARDVLALLRVARAAQRLGTFGSVTPELREALAALEDSSE